MATAEAAVKRALDRIARDGKSLQPPDSAQQAMSVRRSIGAAAPIAFVKPGAVESTGLGLSPSTEDRRVRVHYLGWVLIGLGVLGYRRSRRGLGFVLLGGCTGLLLSLGPVLVYQGEPLFVAGQKVIPLPYLLVEGLPGFDTLTMVYRLAQASALALALLAAAGVSGRKIRWQLAALSLLVLEGQLVAPTASLSMSTQASIGPAIKEANEAGIPVTFHLGEAGYNEGVSTQWGEEALRDAFLEEECVCAPHA